MKETYRILLSLLMGCEKLYIWLFFRGLRVKPAMTLRLFVLCIVVTGNWSLVTAQRAWTLEQCVEYAQKNNIDIKQRSLQVQAAKEDLNTAKNSRLPNLAGGVDETVSFGRAQTALGTYDDIQQSQTNFALRSSMPLFTGFRISNEIARGKLDVAAATENLKKAKEDLSINVVGQFLQVIFCKETLHVTEEQHQLSQKQADKTRFLVESGKLAHTQLLDIQAQVAKDNVAVVEARNSLNLALLNLSQFLELDFTPDFDVTAPDIENQLIAPLQSPVQLYDYAVNVKPIVREQELRAEGAAKDVKIAQAGHLPTLSLDMGISTNYYYLFGDNGGKNETLGEQLNNKRGEYIGISLQIPIFNRFATQNQVKKARINVENQQLAVENAKKTLYKEIQTAYQNALAAGEKLKATEQAVAAATESFKATSELCGLGKATTFDFNEAKTKQTQTQIDRIQAKNEYIFRSKILDFYAESQK